MEKTTLLVRSSHLFALLIFSEEQLPNDVLLSVVDDTCALFNRLGKSAFPGLKSFKDTHMKKTPELIRKFEESFKEKVFSALASILSQDAATISERYTTLKAGINFGFVFHLYYISFISTLSHSLPLSHRQRRAS